MRLSISPCMFSDKIGRCTGFRFHAQPIGVRVSLPAPKTDNNIIGQLCGYQYRVIMRIKKVGAVAKEKDWRKELVFRKIECIQKIRNVLDAKLQELYAQIQK